MSPFQASAGLNGVFRCTTEQATALQRAAEQRRYITAAIDLPRDVSPPTIFEGFASAMRFPEWFGNNWDALADCLSDLSWLDEEGYLIILRGCGRAFPKHEGNWAMLMDILKESAAFWQREGVPFCVLVDEGPQDLPPLPIT
ncbi:barstar family protein [Niveibacterium umoris]|uniref:Barstar (barnase inhibitor) domain-containing protein n=1 Tax=Niveibacterium umoris TaxID=1193620 RepID=A0A840BPF1_9RHOO|nr:hypothetical protein [Niveibacterium umoris]